MKVERLRKAVFAVLVLMLVCGSARALNVGVLDHQKISDTEGNFTGILNNGDYFGVSVASAGDLDGDGVTDIAVGAYEEYTGKLGAVWVLLLNVDGTVRSHQKVSEYEGGFNENLSAYDYFGSSLASIGDLNGDGVPDIAVAEVFDDDGGYDRGAVWIMFMNSDGTVKSYQKISDTQGGFTGTLVDSCAFGSAVANLGDLDGDGVTDIAVGACRDDDGGGNRGSVWILFLNSNGTVKAHQKISDTEGGFTGVLDNGDRFGNAASPLGDLNGDGVLDLAVSAVHDDDGGTDKGAVWILFLNTDGTVKSHQKISETEGNFTGILSGGEPYGGFGTGGGIALLGDLDGDGISDLAVGEALNDDGGTNRGAVWMLFLNADGTVKSHQKISDTDGNFAGSLDDGDVFSRVACLGDLNGDGMTDIVVGAHGDDGGTDRGAVWILFLSAVEPTGTYYVDGVNGSDDDDGLTLGTAFATIQKGVDEANDADTVLVYPAVYTEPVDFDGKAITVQGIATDAGAPIVETPMDYAFSLYTDEEPNSVLKNFVIRNSYLALFLIDASPTIRNLVIVDNWMGAEAYAGSEPDISNCIFYNNTDGDIFGCEAQYSWTQETSDPVTEGLISHWKLDEGSGGTAYDSAADNDGTLVNGPTWTTGILGGALDFDGVNAYVDCGNDPSLYPAELTLAAWIFPRTAGEAGAGRIIANDKHGSTKSYAFGMYGNNLTSCLYLSEGPGGVTTTANPVPFNEWQHVLLTYNGSEVKIYADGMEKGSKGGLSGGVPVGSEVCIGDGGDLYRNFDGVIDDARIYNRALSREEIQEIYRYGLGPMFADANGGDYHLLSERGRYWPEHDVWVLDEATSPCVDGGDPNDNPADERMPNGGRINMGVYGGTAYASMSEWPLKSDMDRDGRVSMKDFAILGGEWLEELGWLE